METETTWKRQKKTEYKEYERLTYGNINVEEHVSIKRDWPIGIEKRLLSYIINDHQKFLLNLKKIYF